MEVNMDALIYWVFVALPSVVGIVSAMLAVKSGRNYEKTLEGTSSFA
jgi:hypothetical protein